MTSQRPFRKSETFNMMMGVAAVLVLGFGTATAAISVAPVDPINPALRPLAAAPGIQLELAVGADDEDCVTVVRKIAQANGKFKLVRRLECQE